MYTRFGNVLAALVVFVAVTCLTASAFAKSPTDYVKKRTKQVTSVLQKPHSEKRQKQLEKILDDVIDFRELAARALGEHWEARTAEEQQQFLDLLSELLRANYESKLEGKKLGEDYEIEYREEKTRGDRAIVKTRVVANDEKKPVDYKLLEKKGAWTIYDVVIDDISLEETYRESYVEMIEEEGWDSLIERMKQKATQLRQAADEQRNSKEKSDKG